MCCFNFKRCCFLLQARAPDLLTEQSACLPACQLWQIMAGQMPSRAHSRVLHMSFCAEVVAGGVDGPTLLKFLTLSCLSGLLA